MQRIEVNGLVYEFKDDVALMSLLDENADRVYEGIVTEKAPPNDPLTLEELREMDGEPVFFVNRDGEQKWGVIHVYHDDSGSCCVEAYFTEYQRMDCWDYGNDGWIAYRRRPGEGTV